MHTAALTRRWQPLSVPLLAQIVRSRATLYAALPKSLMGDVLHYLASQLKKLKRFVEDGC